MQAELVERARDGDKDAFASLVSSSIDGCYALAYRILRDPHRAQDATQQAMLGAWRDLPTLRDSERFDAWLHRLVVHACYAEARGERRHLARVRLLQTEPAHLAGRGALRRRTRRPRPRLPPAVSGTAGGRRPPSPPRVSADGDRGDPGHPRWDRAVPPPLRGPSAADRARRQRSQPRDLRGATRMNRSTEPDFDQRIADWLEDDPNLAPRQAIETVLAAYPSIPQRRTLRAAAEVPDHDTCPSASPRPPSSACSRSAVPSTSRDPTGLRSAGRARSRVRVRSQARQPTHRPAPAWLSSSLESLHGSPPET